MMEIHSSTENLEWPTGEAGIHRQDVSFGNGLPSPQDHSGSPPLVSILLRVTPSIRGDTAQQLGSWPTRFGGSVFQALVPRICCAEPTVSAPFRNLEGPPNHKTRT